MKWTAALLISFLVVSALVLSAFTIRQQQREIHDLRVYIGAGCQGHYQGEGEQP